MKLLELAQIVQTKAEVDGVIATHQAEIVTQRQLVGQKIAQLTEQVVGGLDYDEYEARLADAAKRILFMAGKPGVDKFSPDTLGNYVSLRLRLADHQAFPALRLFAMERGNTPHAVSYDVDAGLYASSDFIINQQLASVGSADGLTAKDRFDADYIQHSNALIVVEELVELGESRLREVAHAHALRKPTLQ